MKLRNNIRIGIFGSEEPSKVSKDIDKLTKQNHWQFIEYITGNLAEQVNLFTMVQYEPDKPFNVLMIYQDYSLEAISAINKGRNTNIPVYIFNAQQQSGFIKRNIVVANYKTYEPKEHDYVVYVGRGNCDKAHYNAHLGNPYTVETYGRGFAIKKFQENLPKGIIDELANHLKCIPKDKRIVLLCWCKPNPCHADIIKQHLEKLL